MIKRYLDIGDVLLKAELPKTEDVLPYFSARKHIDALFQQLSDIYSITEQLQDPSTSLAKARILFAGINDHFPKILQYVRPFRLKLRNPEKSSV